MKAIEDEVPSIRTHHDLASFVQRLVREFNDRPDEWENADLASFLEALAGWIEDMDGYYANMGEPFPDPPHWRTFADMLLGARVYD